jgi:flagellar hook-associated protein 3 FlgL
MGFVSFGDLAQSFVYRQQNSRLKADSNKYSTELVTGITSSISRHVSGDFTRLGEIETTLKTLSSYKLATTEAAQFSAAMQTSLGVVQDWSDKTASGLLVSAGTEGQTRINSVANVARTRFSAVVSALNTQIGGQSLFAGTGTGGPAIAPAEQMLTDLKVAIAAETTAAGISAVVDDWFSQPGGGYETTGYLGSATTLAPFSVGKGQTVEMDATALDPAIRDTLKSFAKAALVAEGILSGDSKEQAKLLRRAGEELLESSSRQTELRARIGAGEEQIEVASVQNSAETTTLEIYRSDLLAIDPYEAATRLEATQNSLETMYALTARMSRLHLTDFLR